MTDPLTQLRDALQTVITTSEHALVPRALLRELLARLDAAEVVVEKADALLSMVYSKPREPRAYDSMHALRDALSAHAKLKDAP